VKNSSRKRRDGTEFDERYLEVITSLESLEKKSNRDEKKIYKNLKYLEENKN
jgi:hypothetical protein